MGKAAILGLKELRKALRSLLNYADYSIYKIQDALSPLVLCDGLSVVPDDILALIFEKAFEAAPWSTSSLAAVNRRFRNVALSLPRLWSILPEQNGKHTFDLYLARSKDVGLTVDLRNALSWYGKEMMQRTHRWESVAITHRDIQGINLQILSFPRIQNISVELSYAGGTSGWVEEFKLEWELPALRHLTFQNATPALPPSVLANLTSLELKLEFNTTCRFRNGDFLRQLNLMDNLQVLSLTICSMQFGEENPSLLCDLSSLIELNIELSGEVKCSDLRAFLDKINMKSVHILSAKLREEFFAREVSSHEGLSSIISNSSHRLRFPNMDAATLIVQSKRVDGELAYVSMEYLLGHLALRTLYVSAPEILLLDPQIFKDYKLSLRDVNLVGCNFGVRKLLDLFLTHVNPDGTRLCSSIKKLSVLGCPEVTMNYLLDFLPEEKIDWSPIVDDYSSK